VVALVTGFSAALSYGGFFGQLGFRPDLRLCGIVRSCGARLLFGGVSHPASSHRDVDTGESGGPRFSRVPL